jgi:hypothetical protein
MEFHRPAHAFSAARRTLMLPFPKGEDRAIAAAFYECWAGLRSVLDEDLDDEARECVRRLRRLIDVEGLDDESGEGLWLTKARLLTKSQNRELSHVVDSLADWFARSTVGIDGSRSG